jgi:hypothetical protein
MILPPPDPHEPRDPEGMSVDTPMALFGAGRPSGEVERLANAILDARPGILFVFRR